MLHKQTVIRLLKPLKQNCVNEQVFIKKNFLLLCLMTHLVPFTTFDVSGMLHLVINVIPLLIKIRCDKGDALR